VKKTNLFFKAVIISFLVIPAASVYLSAAAKVVPVFNFSLLGGKYFLDGDAASFEGNASLYAASSFKFSENAEIMPIYSGYYNGTQDVEELAGGGILTRERQGHSLSLKYIYGKNFNKIKPRISYSREYVNETNDEDWGEGLFDYNTFSAGIEFEQERPYATFTESYDFFQVKYPNYASLISQVQTVIDTTTFAELSSNAGADTMNNVNHMLTFSYTWFPEPFVMKVGYEFLYTNYPEQPVVGKPVTGSAYFKSEKRKDITSTINYTLRRKIKPLNLSFSAEISYLSSNQNSYDSSRTKYIGDYYSYFEINGSPTINLSLKNGGLFSVGLSWKKYYYTGRYAQDSSGSYKNSKTYQTFWLSTFSLKYPLMKGLSARASYSYQVSNSNMKYEADYRYNYRASNYLMGVEWEF